MDAEHWKVLVDKAILGTQSFDLIWSECGGAPPNALAFMAPVDEDTTLSIWGYRTGYSYELSLENPKYPPIEPKRVTTKEKSEGIDYSGLFRAAQRQIESARTNKTFKTLMDYIADPAAISSQDGFPYRWSQLDDSVDVSSEQWAELLAMLTNMTKRGALIWQVTTEKEIGQEVESEDYKAEMGDHLTLSFAAGPTPGFVKGTYDYGFSVDNHEGFVLEIDLGPNQKSALLNVRHGLEDLHQALARPLREEANKFEKIVEADMINRILAAFDKPKGGNASTEET